MLASGERAAELGVESLARVVSSAVYGIDPLVMGLAPGRGAAVGNQVRPA